MSMSQALAEKEVLEMWFEFSKLSAPYVDVPKLTMYIPRFIMYICKKFDLEKNVFFASVEILEKYSTVVRYKKKHCSSVLTVLAGVLIGNKLVGVGGLEVNSILRFLNENNLGNFTRQCVFEKERKILTRTRFDLPLHTIYDEMNVLFDMTIHSLKIPFHLLRGQCIEVMKLYYLHSRMVCEVLKEIYAMNIAHFHKLMEHKYYIPAGVIITAVALSKSLQLISVEEITTRMCALLNLSANDFHTIYLTLSETLREVMNSSDSSD